MKVKLICFGIARDIIGAREQLMEVPDKWTVGEMRSHIKNEFEEMKGLRSFSIAINDEYVTDSHLITAHDELIIIPPVSGG